MHWVELTEEIFKNGLWKKGQHSYGVESQKKFMFSGAREFVRANRASTPDDLMNSALAGFGSGAILGRLQG